MKARYLSFFSYIGTNFRASEKIWLKEKRNYPDPLSVQGLLELALLKLRSVNYPAVFLSSRTDSGVHALNSAAHFDLDRSGSRIYDPDEISHRLNQFFFKNNCSIYVKKSLRVPDDFLARFHAKSRTYLYRLAILKKGVVLPERNSLGLYIPIEEWKRCLFLRHNDLDMAKFKAGAEYFVGLHDFSTFKRFDKLKQHKHCRRLIYSVDVQPGKRLVTSYTDKHVDDDMFDYWEVLVRGRGFVHNQIRRMVGTLITVAQGKLAPEDIKVMLQVPSKHSWHSFIQSIRPDGLYLCDVEYDPKDLIYTSVDKESVKEEHKEDGIEEDLQLHSNKLVAKINNFN